MTKQLKEMKKKFFKATLAVAAIATVGLSSFRTYQSYMTDSMTSGKMLLSEDVEALSQWQGEVIRIGLKVCTWIGTVWTCYQACDAVTSPKHLAWATTGKSKPEKEYYSNGNLKREYTLYEYSCQQVDGSGEDGCKTSDKPYWASH